MTARDRWPGENQGVAVDDYDAQRRAALEDGQKRINDVVADTAADAYLRGYEMGVAAARAEPKTPIATLVAHVREVIEKRKRERQS